MSELAQKGNKVRKHVLRDGKNPVEDEDPQIALVNLETENDELRLQVNQLTAERDAAIGKLQKIRDALL